MRLSRLQEEGQVSTRQLGRQAVDRESTIEDWLHAAPTFVLDEPLLLIGRQTPLETGISDLLGIDRYGHTVVCEIKKGDSGSGSASEESIISQPLAYASALAPLKYEDLEEIYAEYREQLETDEWAVDTDVVPGETLLDAFETTFGTSMHPDSFNREQRLAVVAESITERTKSSVRDLLDRGIHFQAVEVQRFIEGGSEERTDRPSSLLVGNTVIDYDHRRVRPKNEGNPTYSREVAEIIDRIFPEVRGIVGAATPGDISPDDLEVREPALHSHNPQHPDSISYSIRLKPRTGGVARGALDIKGTDDDAVATIRDNAALFEERGLEVSRSRSTHRVVMFESEVESVSELSDDGFQREYVERFVELIRTAHEVFEAKECT